MNFKDYCEKHDISPLSDDYFAEKMNWESTHDPLSDDYVKEDYRDEYDD